MEGMRETEDVRRQLEGMRSHGAQQGRAIDNISAVLGGMQDAISSLAAAVSAGRGASDAPPTAPPSFAPPRAPRGDGAHATKGFVLRDVFEGLRPMKQAAKIDGHAGFARLKSSAMGRVNNFSFLLSMAAPDQLLAMAAAPSLPPVLEPQAHLDCLLLEIDPADTQALALAQSSVEQHRRALLASASQRTRAIRDALHNVANDHYRDDMWLAAKALLVAVPPELKALLVLLGALNSTRARSRLPALMQVPSVPREDEAGAYSALAAYIADCGDKTDVVGQVVHVGRHGRR